ncbi:hypothetical protein PSHT_15155 [Puccinia striiformis]|uniref:RDRP core domain-containing protein n=1 Tax=Puccinia striiformis TaxID=27350 RepID=A0A2S4UGK8_9BASI|nr:hypothetical protein PSHT_15155 [Puccinia striiformis]
MENFVLIALIIFLRARLLSSTSPPRIDLLSEAPSQEPRPSSFRNDVQDLNMLGGHDAPTFQLFPTLTSPTGGEFSSHPEETSREAARTWDLINDLVTIGGRDARKRKSVVPPGHELDEDLVLDQTASKRYQLDLNHYLDPIESFEAQMYGLRSSPQLQSQTWHPDETHGSSYAPSSEGNQVSGVESQQRSRNHLSYETDSEVHQITARTLQKPDRPNVPTRTGTHPESSSPNTDAPSAHHHNRPMGETSWSTLNPGRTGHSDLVEEFAFNNLNPMLWAWMSVIWRRSEGSIVIQLEPHIDSLLEKLVASCIPKNQYDTSQLSHMRVESPRRTNQFRDKVKEFADLLGAVNSRALELLGCASSSDSYIPEQRSAMEWFIDFMKRHNEYDERQHGEDLEKGMLLYQKVAKAITCSDEKQMYKVYLGTDFGDAENFALRLGNFGTRWTNRPIGTILAQFNKDNKGELVPWKFPFGKDVVKRPYKNPQGISIQFKKFVTASDFKTQAEVDNPSHVVSFSMEPRGVEQWAWISAIMPQGSYQVYEEQELTLRSIGILKNYIEGVVRNGPDKEEKLHYLSIHEWVVHHRSEDLVHQLWIISFALLEGLGCPIPGESFTEEQLSIRSFFEFCFSHMQTGKDSNADVFDGKKVSLNAMQKERLHNLLMDLIFGPGPDERKQFLVKRSNENDATSLVLSEAMLIKTQIVVEILGMYYKEAIIQKESWRNNQDYSMEDGFGKFSWKCAWYLELAVEVKARWTGDYSSRCPSSHFLYIQEDKHRLKQAAPLSRRHIHAQLVCTGLTPSDKFDTSKWNASFMKLTTDPCLCGTDPLIRDVLRGSTQRLTIANRRLLLIIKLPSCFPGSIAWTRANAFIGVGVFTQEEPNRHYEMEIEITNYLQQIDEDSTRYRLIELVSNIVHEPPLHQPGDDPINFDLSFFVFDPNRSRTRKGRGQSRQPRPSDLLQSQIHKSWRLTFPSVAFGQRFLDLVSKASPQEFGFSHKVEFAQATIPLGNRGTKIKVPNPNLLQKLKTTPFVSPLEERMLEEERQKSAHDQIYLASIEFGGLSGQDCLSTDATFRSEYQINFYNPFVEFNLEIDNQRNDDRDPATVYIDHSSAQIIVCRVRDNILDQFTMIHSKTVKRIETHSSSILLFTECPPTFHSSPHFNMNDINSLAAMLSLSNQAVRSRHVGFDVDQRRVIPFASHVIRLNFPTEKECKKFLSQRHRFVLPRIIHLERGIERTAVYTSANLLKVNEVNCRLDLAVAFQLDSLLYNLILNPVQIIQLSEYVKDLQPSMAERVLIRLASDLSLDHDGQPQTEQTPQTERQNQPASFSDDQLIQKFKAALERCSSKSRNLFDRQERLENVFKCRSVTITPTTLILEGPLPDESNSILRLYDYNSAFIRVAIRDEDGSNHHHDREVNGREFLRQRYRPFLVNGLYVAGRRFGFLGYSSSALKCHQAWFVCPFLHKGEVMRAETIRSRMGTFSKVNKIPARYMARIAQAFTTTQRAVTLAPSQLRLIPDVERNGSVFTDGVGTISPALARQVEQALLGKMMILKRRNAIISSCYQIRLGGYKGMLSIDPTLPGEIVRLRPSMSKFDADSYTLDIASSFRRPLPSFLNRPLIKILEDLKIPSHVFMSAQRNTIQSIERSRGSFHQSAKLMQKAGLDLAIIECLRDLKYRARIPLEGSYTLVGVADEESRLQEGEIYACVQEKGKARKYLSGRIAISRSPSIHPGDVQVVHAIGRPPPASEKLGALVNCVVFPVLGKRSLPSCLGGGDLDGDLYTLITDPRMIPYTKHISSPGSYPAVTMKYLSEPCTIEDGVDFFLDYISSDLVGMIATDTCRLLIAKHLEHSTRIA